jgi:hypothetical protein
MIIVPAWIQEEKEDGFLALLGSEPSTESALELVPRSCVEGYVYSTEQRNGKTFAVLTLSANNLPAHLRKILKLDKNNE